MSDSLKKYIREIPDYPKEGILFYDITTLLGNPTALRETVDRFVWLFSGQRVDTVEMHKDAVEAGERVLIVDDLLATGGTARATADLAAAQGAEILGFGFIVELGFLSGRDRLGDYSVQSLIIY